VVSVRRRRVHLLAADVGENRFFVARIVLEQSLHRGQRRRHALLVRVVEGEAHAEQDVPLEALPGVRSEQHRILMPTGVEQESGDLLDRTAVDSSFGHIHVRQGLLPPPGFALTDPAVPSLR